MSIMQLLLHHAACLTVFSNVMCLFPPGLADENESVREAALSAGHVLVEHYATTYALFITIFVSLLIDGCSYICTN